MKAINYEVPFYSNTPDNLHCFQAVFKMVLKYFKPDKEFTWEELDKITAKVEGLWTWPTAGLLWLHSNGFEVKTIDPFDNNEFIKHKGQYLIDLMGEEVGRAQIENSDIDQEVRHTKIFVRTIQPEERIPNIDDIKELLQKGYLVICNINPYVLNDKTGYSGHFVLIKGLEGETFFLHDPGLPAYENRQVAIEKFEQAWAYPDKNAKNIMALKPEIFK